MPGIYIGKPWNTDMPTGARDYRICPNYIENVLVDIMAYEDAEYFTCPRCKARAMLKPENGRFGYRGRLEKDDKRDPTKSLHDFKRNFYENSRHHWLTRERRIELGIED